MGDEGYQRIVRHLPPINFGVLASPLDELRRFYLEQIQRRTTDGVLRPPDLWTTLRLILLCSIQNYAGTLILVERRRPKPLLVQAAAITRSSLEAFANLQALLQDPGRLSEFMLDGFETMAAQYRHQRSRFDGIEKWREHLRLMEAGLVQMAAELGVVGDDWKTPLPEDQLRPSGHAIRSARRSHWLTPGKMLDSAGYLTGGRFEVLKEVYRFWYGTLSAEAHQRMAALGLAGLVENPAEQWNPGHGESQAAMLVMLFLAATLAELQDYGQFERHPRLDELWFHLREMDDEAKELWSLRYERLVTLA